MILGLMSAVALLVVKSQVPIILGWHGWSRWRGEPVSLSVLVTGGVVSAAILLSGAGWPASRGR